MVRICVSQGIWSIPKMVCKLTSPRRSSKANREGSLRAKRARAAWRTSASGKVAFGIVAMVGNRRETRFEQSVEGIRRQVLANLQNARRGRDDHGGLHSTDGIASCASRNNEI